MMRKVIQDRHSGRTSNHFQATLDPLERAQAVLQKAANEKDVVVRNAVTRALRGGGA